MRLDLELQELARKHLTKKDRIRLHELTGIRMSGVYNACRGVRELTPIEYDTFVDYIKSVVKCGS